MKIATAALVFAFCTQVFAQGDKPITLPPMETVGFFALGPVGFAMTTSAQEKKFRSIMALPPYWAKRALEKLYSTGDAAAMSYAIVGMRTFDRTRYAEMLASARASDLMVETGSGCILWKEPLRQIADDIDAGKYDEPLRKIPTYPIVQ